MASADTDAATNGIASGRDRFDRPADEYAISFRRKLRLITLSLLVINVAIGLFARYQQRATIATAVEIYDKAFVSTN